jgi:hypothetical protein
LSPSSPRTFFFFVRDGAFLADVFPLELR